jgi:hypothetical protein
MANPPKVEFGIPKPSRHHIEYPDYRPSTCGTCGRWGVMWCKVRGHCPEKGRSTVMEESCDKHSTKISREQKNLRGMR